MHSLYITGWVSSDEPGSLELTLFLRGVRLASIRCDPPSRTGSDKQDFSVAVAPEALRHAGTGILRVVARSESGRTSTIALTFVRRVSRVPSRMSRSEYGRVWDSVSVNRTQARVSVAGYSDDAEWQRSGASTAEYVAKLLEVGPTDRVLEIGCGTGRVGAHLAPRCQAWVGADVSANMLRFAEEELRAHPNVTFARLNGFNLDGIDRGAFDAVYCSAVFMHLDEWDRYRYVKDALSVLKPGGRAFFDNYNLLGEAGWKFFEETSLLDVATRPPNVSRSSTPQELKEYLSRAGYVDIRVEAGDLFVTVLGSRPPESRAVATSSGQTLESV